MRRIAITGATGLIGTALARFLRCRGDSVLTIGRNPQKSDVSWNPGAREINLERLEGLDALVHLAGERIDGRWTIKKKRRILESRTVGTEFLADSIAQLGHPPPVVVSASAIGFYGSRSDEELTEDSPSGSGFLAEVCRRWELAASPMSTGSTRLAIARTGIVCSLTEGAFRKLLIPIRMGLGGKLGSGKQWWSWITLEDEIRALAHLIDNDIEGPANLVSPAACRNYDFVRAIAQEIHRPALLPTPSLVLRILLGDMADELLLSSSRVLPGKLEHSGFKFEAGDLKTALTDLLKDR